MVLPTITVGVVAGGSPGSVERTVGTVLGQLGEEDRVIVVLLEGIDAPSEVAMRISEVRSAYRDMAIGLVAGEATSFAEARNSIVKHSESDVVAFMDDGGLAMEGWLKSIREAFIDQEITAVAGAIESPDNVVEPGAPSGGKLRWTGHIVTDYSSTIPSQTSLASGRNCAVRFKSMVEMGGFDETFTAGWPYEDVEFFTRLAKAGRRTYFIPDARIATQPLPDSYSDILSGEDQLDLRCRQSRSMAAIFARHEAWALLLMMVSHLLAAVVDVFASRLPTNAPLRIAGELIVGVRAGVRPVARQFGEKR